MDNIPAPLKEHLKKEGNNKRATVLIRFIFKTISSISFPVQNGNSSVQNGNSSFPNGNSSVQNGKIIISINIKKLQRDNIGV